MACMMHVPQHSVEQASYDAERGGVERMLTLQACAAAVQQAKRGMCMTMGAQQKVKMHKVKMGSTAPC